MGFADIVGSARISNAVDLETEWEIKEQFLASAVAHATASGMVVLNQMGDGFFFLANYQESEDWSANLMSFHAEVTKDLRAVLSRHQQNVDIDTSGLRFGVAKGSVLLGWIGKDQAYFTAVGRAVNLAARLCAAAQPGHIAFSLNAWQAMATLPIEHGVDRIAHADLKGFSSSEEAMHVWPLDSSSKQVIPPLKRAGSE